MTLPATKPCSLVSRREVLGWSAAALIGSLLSSVRKGEADETKPAPRWKPNFVVASSLFGNLSLREILPNLKACHTKKLDIWHKPHGTQRDEMNELGREGFLKMAEEHEVQVAVGTCYPLGPFKLQEEMTWLKSLGGHILVCGARGPANVSGAEAKREVTKFLEEMKPHLGVAEEQGITIAIENHSNQFLFTPDSIRYFAEMNKSKNLGIAFAPHHLYKFEADLTQLFRDVCHQVPFFYAQEYHKSAYEKSEKEEELKQLPGLGKLNYASILAVMRELRFEGLIEVMMHPMPRGVPILPTAKEVAAEIDKASLYLEGLVDG